MTWHPGWSAESELGHGISLATLIADGVPHERVARRAAQVLGLCCKLEGGWVGGAGRDRGRRRGDDGSGRRVQGAALHGRGDPVGATVVSGVSDQLSRSLRDAGGSRGGGRPYDAVSLGAGLMRRRWSSGSVGICGHAPAPGGRTRRISRSRASGPISIGRWTASARRSTSCSRPGGMPRRPSGSSARRWRSRTP